MRSQEIQYLNDLIRDFGISSEIEPSRALQIIQMQEMRLRKYFIPKSVSSLQRQNLIPSLFWPEQAKYCHKQLFGEILTNAGNYRQSAEPNDGIVHFGLNQRFTGTPPMEIPMRIEWASSHLISNPPDPVAQAATFYQQFVNCHPFYDGNGRIGRLIVTVYLEAHSHYIDWEALQQNNKWIARLNACHKRESGDPDNYQAYLGYLINYWRKFITQWSDELIDAPF